jgi:hypothetical protein
VIIEDDWRASRDTSNHSSCNAWTRTSIFSTMH